jgi:hypothetical protein
MAEPKKSVITSEVERRLNELFGDSDPESEPVEEIPEPIEETDFIDELSILRQLKAIILSIDWEIKDEYLHDLISESERLKEDFRHDKSLFLLLQMLGSIGKYLLKKKAGAHPDSISLLKSVYESIEKIVTSEGMTESEKETELSMQIARFNQLKEAIKKAGKTRVEEEQTPERLEVPQAKPGEAFGVEGVGVPPGIFQDAREEDAKMVGVGPEVGQGLMRPHEAFLYALEEIREMIRAEFRAIRAELKLWRESEK